MVLSVITLKSFSVTTELFSLFSLILYVPSGTVKVNFPLASVVELPKILFVLLESTADAFKLGAGVPSSKTTVPVIIPAL